ncbi:potassium channel family protein [Calditerrivibrio nitroreducens]|uniref:TrkA-N domain protein n=1 Tax=Calditerrivibrio nitroreducens (strain DSM 19672 / NBRC 101217 / Yu37-1) TaxID=768670 RepID=E4TK31_CALNY|nr:TrkA family potassium uptake protein [Calditerrivibrio nitroreducens]ADR19307.1 TrkA-N domain protein [Calditerrivibrio nitroreducens DSM 19672]
MKKRDILVIGLGIFGYELAVELSKKGLNVLAVDKNPDIINKIKDFVSEAIIADASSEETLRELDVTSFDEIILGISSNFEALILSATIMRKLGVKKIIAKANSEIQKEVLLKIGVNEVILPEKEVATRLADKISKPGILDLFHMYDDAAVATVKVPSKFVGKSLKEIDLRNKYDVNAVTIRRNGVSKIIKNPDIVFEEGDEIVVIGDEDKIKNLF